MFGDLPKLLDREFLIGYYLPASVGVAASVFLLAHHGVLDGSAILAWVAAHQILAMAIAAVVVWIVSGLLLAGNGWIIRVKEGYGWLGLILTPLGRTLFRLKKKAIADIEAKIADVEATIADEKTRKEKLSRLQRAKIAREQELEIRFPDDEAKALPWSFGNTVKAFEVYPRIVYGVDAIALWGRLWLVMPDDSREAVNGAKSQVDFMVNLGAVSWFLLLEYAVLAEWVWPPDLLWFPIVAIVAIRIFSVLAEGAAMLWGELVKSSFDLYLPRLHSELGLPARPSAEQAREQWRQVSRAVLYRDPRQLELAKAAGAVESGAEARRQGPRLAS